MNKYTTMAGYERDLPEDAIGSPLLDDMDDFTIHSAKPMTHAALLSPVIELSIALEESKEREKVLAAALRRIRRWHDEFPATGKFYPNGDEMSFGVCYGSNGERDYMRGIADGALDILLPATPDQTKSIEQSPAPLAQGEVKV